MWVFCLFVCLFVLSDCSQDRSEDLYRKDNANPEEDHHQQLSQPSSQTTASPLLAVFLLTEAFYSHCSLSSRCSFLLPLKPFTLIAVFGLIAAFPIIRAFYSHLSFFSRKRICSHWSRLSAQCSVYSHCIQSLVQPLLAMYPLSVFGLQPVTLLAVSPLLVTISSHGSLLCSLLCSFSSHCSLSLSLLHHGQPFLSLQPLQPFFSFSLFAVSSEAFPLTAFLHFDYSLSHCSLSCRLLLTMQSLLKPFLSLQLF